MAVWIFKLFASLRLAVFLLAALALAFATGTFLESAYGTEAARLLIYRSPWMSLLLILLALNVAAAALDRLPWKRKHVGFVATHAGIILMLAGSLMTRAFGVEGQMAIREGETDNRIILNQSMLELVSKEEGSLRTFEIPLRPFSWKGRESFQSDPTVWLLRYFPKASRREKVEESREGPAALQVVLESSFMKASQWLVLEDAEKGSVNLGPAELRFSRERIMPSLQKQSAEEGFLEFQFETSSIPVPIQENISKAVRLKGTPYQVTILRVFKDALVDEGRLVERSTEWNNPACELILEGNGLKERHTVFQKYPDFPTLHGMKPSQSGARIVYRRPEKEGAGPKNELRFIWQANGLPSYQVKKGDPISEGTVQLGEDRETGWMDFKFRVERYYPHARLSSLFFEEPLTGQADEHLSAVEIELEKGNEKKIFWLGQGDRKDLILDNHTFRVIYGLRTLPLGFRLMLRDFRVEHYPGTDQPASFESDVTLKDDFTGTVRDLTIRMNQPLKHRGYKVFQSGYQQVPGQPEVSIFSVAKDPGIPVKYAGALVLIGGILTMFYSRRFSGDGPQRDGPQRDRSGSFLNSFRGVPAGTVPVCVPVCVLKNQESLS